jgi:hypothetical protein
MGSIMMFFSFEQSSPYVGTLRNDGDLLMFQVALNEVTSSTTTEATERPYLISPKCCC